MAEALIPVAGGCSCGAVRYQSDAAPTEGFYCHCRTCQKHFGNLFGAFVRMARASFRFTKGEPQYYRSSEVARRGFCRSCGSPLVFVYDGNGDFWVAIGSLDHPEDWPLTKAAPWGPSTHGMVDFKVPWHVINDGLPQRTSENAVLLEQAKAELAEHKR